MTRTPKRTGGRKAGTGRTPDPLASASAVPPALPASVPRSADALDTIAAKLKAGREQQEVVGPLVQLLTGLGWHLNQIEYGKLEWRVPKSPSQATKREKGESFEGWPVDVAVFDSSARFGDPDHLLMIIETKNPDEDSGVSQLERYLSMEPRARLGIWTNTADPSSVAVFLYRQDDGTHLRRRRPLNELPRPGEAIRAKVRRLKFEDLQVPSAEALRRAVEEMLDRVVIQDSNVTRREEQLDQLCGLLLLKLDSDKRGKLDPNAPPLFRPLESEARTAEEIRKAFAEFVRVYPDTFTTSKDRELRLSDSTIYQCVEILSPYRLIDIGIASVSTAFQVLRTAALIEGEGQYFTPQPVIEAGVRLLKIGLQDLVIDPACGSGGFVLGVLVEMQRRHPGKESELSRWAQTHLFGIDKDGVGIKLTKAIMQIAEDGSAHCVRGDSIRKYLWQKDYPHLKQSLFSDGRFSVVVTNPPFGAGLTITANEARLSELDIAKVAGQGQYSDLEIGLLFLQRAHQLLRVGGRLGIVLPETYFFSPAYSWLFKWLKPRLRPLIVANVPMEAFMGFCRAKTNFYIFEKIANA